MRTAVARPYDRAEAIMAKSDLLDALNVLASAEGFIGAVSTDKMDNLRHKTGVRPTRNVPGRNDAWSGEDLFWVHLLLALLEMGVPLAEGQTKIASLQRRRGFLEDVAAERTILAVRHMTNPPDGATRYDLYAPLSQDAALSLLEEQGAMRLLDLTYLLHIVDVAARNVLRAKRARYGITGPEGE